MVLTKEQLEEHELRFSTTFSDCLVYIKKAERKTIFVFWNPKTGEVELILPRNCIIS
ncbi:MAG: hypothetical protein Q8O39_02320 [bacterium]|nr:hypothetical protein [bacterium]